MSNTQQTAGWRLTGMSSDSDLEALERDSQSQFVSQEGDEDVLWEVVEITAEKSKFYKVRWAGVDPKTNKPWAQSWVRKADCTDDLVREWKRKELKRKKNAKGARQSTTSRASGVSRTSEASSSIATKRSTRSGTATAEPPRRAKSNTKRTRSTASADDVQDEGQTARPVGHPRKRRKKNNGEVEKVEARNFKKVANSRVTDSDGETPEEVVKAKEHFKGKVMAVKEEEEESSESEGGEGPVRPPGSVTPPAPIPSTNLHPPPKTPTPTSTPTPTPTPEPDTAYVKFKSGIISTPITKKKKRRHSDSIVDPSSSSDEVDFVAPIPTSQLQEQVPELDNATRTPDPHSEVPHEGEEQMFEEFGDFENAHPRPKSGPRVSANSNSAKDDSYRREVVPETEPESSNNTQSQSQSQPLPPPPLQQRQPSPPPRPRPSVSSQDYDGLDLSYPTEPQNVPNHEEEHPESPLHAPVHTHAAPPRPKRVPTVIIPPQPTTPARSSLISRMKPRTPGSTSRISLFEDDADMAYHAPALEIHMEVDEEQEERGEPETELSEEDLFKASSSKPTKASARPLRPLPRLSPSQFTPHLPTSPASDLRNDGETGAADEYDEAEVAELVSSIEQFSSPEKGRRKRKPAQYVEEKTRRKGKNREVPEAESSVTDGEGSATESLEDVVQVRGQQLAARARAEKQKQQREFNGESAQGKKRTLKELLSKSAERKGKEKRQRELETEMIKLRSSKHTPGPWWEKGKKKKKSSREQSEEQTVEHDASWSEMRYEEEESAQDIMMDFAAAETEDIQMDEALDAAPSAQVPEEMPESHSQPEPQPSPVVNANEHKHELQLRHKLDHESNNTHDHTLQHAHEVTAARAKSKSSSRSGSSSGRIIQRQTSKEELVLPPTARVPSSPPSPLESQEHVNHPDFVATLALLNEKSQENVQLAKEIDALREALAAAQASRAQDSETQRQLESTQTNLQAAQTALSESERRAVELARGKESAEKEREFFRDHYGQASGFVTTVREENAELQKEAQIARDQAKNGVEVVKATYMARVKALEDDARTYKRLAMFIMEKDVRTNDDIRRRAAEEPELRTRCGELAVENRRLKTEIAELQDEVDDKERALKDLDHQLGSWKKQTTLLNADLSKLKSAQEGEDKVYQCGWRIGDDVSVPCEEVFANYEEFERHMFSDQHLDVRRAFA